MVGDSQVNIWDFLGILYDFIGVNGVVGDFHGEKRIMVVYGFV